MISGLQIFMMFLQAVFGFMIPLFLLICLKRRYSCNPMAFVTGAAVMLVFAFILEQFVHQFVLGSSLGAQIQSNIWLYAIYGGLMAALFEETGRYIAMHNLMKNMYGNDMNAVMYGAGHGGFECMVLLGITGINNLALAMTLRGADPSALPESVQALLPQFAAVPAYTYLLGILERFSAICLQIALSVFVWKAAKGGKKYGKYLLLAYLLHFAVDACTVILSSLIPVILLELLLLAVCICVLVYSLRILKQKPVTAG